MWDTATGQCTHALGSHAGTVFSAVFTADTLGLYTADEAGEVRAWDLRTKECRGVMKTHFSAVTALALSPGGDVLASAGRDKVVALWDTRTLKQRGTVATDEAIEGVQLLDGTTPLGRAVGAPAADAFSLRCFQNLSRSDVLCSYWHLPCKGHWPLMKRLQTLSGIGNSSLVGM